MGVFNHVQRSFAAGELSPRVHGQVGTEIHEKGLSLSSRMQPLPQGPLRMSAGSWYMAEIASVPRLIPFNVSGGEPYALVLEDVKLSIYDRAGARQGIRQNYVVNGSFHAGMTGWTESNPGISATWQTGGYVRINQAAAGRYHIYQSNVPITAAGLNRLKLRARGVTAAATVRLVLATGVTTHLDVTVAVTARWTILTADVAAPGAATATLAIYGETGIDVEVDDVEITRPNDAAADSFVAPWTAAQLAAIQHDQDLTKNRMLLVHGNVAPQLLALSVHGTWEFGAAPFLNPPAQWGGAYWPACVDWGFQGRLWLGAVPDEPNTFWGSASGSPFTFTSGGSNPGDPVSFSASVRGALRWLQGQKVLLLGAERVEQSASGGSSVIAPGNIDVRDESAFGSAAIQAAHIGDQAIWVTRDGRHVRAMNYSNDEDGWVSRALTFLAEHMTSGGLKEIAFSRAPDPTILALRNDGLLLGCTYDRAEQVLAWWRIPLAGAAPVNSMCLVDAPAGGEVILSATRAGGEYLERLPLHEDGVVYVDSAVSGVVAGDGTFGGLAHLNGETVRVIVGGALRADQVVAGGSVTVDVDDAGQSIVVGLAYLARGKTLKPEGGNPRGTAQGTKRSRPRVFLRLNDSAIPLVNDQRPDGVVPIPAMNTSAGRVTGDVEYPGIDVDEDGQVTIEQDLPFRTEVLAVFGPVSVNDV